MGTSNCGTTLILGLVPSYPFLQYKISGCPSFPTVAWEPFTLVPHSSLAWYPAIPFYYTIFQDVHHFQLWHGNQLLWYHTHLRPGTQQFLEKISKLYELHICTFGVRMYAHTIAKILDPDGKYFSHRILSRDECFSAASKTANLK